MVTAAVLVAAAAVFLAATWWQTRPSTDEMWATSVGIPGNVARWFVRGTGILGATVFLVAAGFQAFR